MQLTRWTSRTRQISTKGHIALYRTVGGTTSKTLSIDKLAQPSTLAGSLPARICPSLRGSPRQELFSNYLLSFSLDQSGRSNVAPGSGGWATVGVPRIIAIAVFNGFGMHAFDDLRWSDSRSTRGTEACSPRNIPSPSHRTSGLSAIYRPKPERLGKLFGCSSGQNDDVSYADRFASVVQGSWQRCSCCSSPGNRPHLTHA